MVEAKSELFLLYCGSGGYEDDKDEGDVITYTGEGGQPRREDGKMFSSSKVQVRDQEWVRGNKALKTSWMKQSPVRVIRGHTLNSRYAPAEGYRYDGLYNVVNATLVRGKRGYLVCQFRFRRRPNQLPLPGALRPEPERVEKSLFSEDEDDSSESSDAPSLQEGPSRKAKMDYSSSPPPKKVPGRQIVYNVSDSAGERGAPSFQEGSSRKAKMKEHSPPPRKVPGRKTVYNVSDSAGEQVSRSFREGSSRKAKGKEHSPPPRKVTGRKTVYIASDSAGKQVSRSFQEGSSRKAKMKEHSPPPRKVPGRRKVVYDVDDSSDLDGEQVAPSFQEGSSRDVKMKDPRSPPLKQVLRRQEAIEIDSDDSVTFLQYSKSKPAEMVFSDLEY
ncbi:PUA-like domain-containing protein [Crassisporium funariophilum]|nr:PUA-like domain-containing protein [Crassisporium funariophilum]